MTKDNKQICTCACNCGNRKWKDALWCSLCNSAIYRNEPDHGSKPATDIGEVERCAYVYPKQRGGNRPTCNQLQGWHTGRALHKFKADDSEGA